ncbi:MAG TPA: type II toxin-antitoxin system VapC family toxin [Saprospiraceae bacterium]|nr:type II toxin-antitoxin system VapC family toxin [Saprospiraceae bacterium]HMP13642.1 type II toxin-antitoxin system VapC family toxin [Saprospiraceae bacterium]
MSSKAVFVDSSILIEYYKNTQTALLDKLLDTQHIQVCISQIVVSEYLFHCLGIDGGKSPLSVKQAKSIATVLSNGNHAVFLKQFSYLQDSNLLVERVPELMSQYNLLPNDALILSLCQIHQIPAVASYDTDFKNACVGLNIALLQNVSDYNNFLKDNH